MCLLKFYSLCLLLFFLAEMALAALGKLIFLFNLDRIAKIVDFFFRLPTTSQSDGFFGRNTLG